MTEQEDKCPECKKVVWIWQKKVWRIGRVYHKKCYVALKWQTGDKLKCQ